MFQTAQLFELDAQPGGMHPEVLDMAVAARRAEQGEGELALASVAGGQAPRPMADHSKPPRPVAVTLGRSEGLEAHARSVAVRLNLP